MKQDIASSAIVEDVEAGLREHLIRADGQEDLCFALYHPSSGERRFTALITESVYPAKGDRQIHGTASFNSPYFERVLAAAGAAGMGIAFLHSHPSACAWQGMSEDDYEAEAGMAGTVSSATGLPLVGLTVSGCTGFWSARHWKRRSPRTWIPQGCENVRVVGKNLKVATLPSRPPKELPPTLMRTVNAWGADLQENLSSLRVGIVGLGSVGSVVAEALARMGFGELVCIDPDQIHEINLDRTLHAYPETASVSEPKAVLAARSAFRSATLPHFSARAIPSGIQEIATYREALDCDVLFSCVDRPWPRAILNHIAYAHLIPVIDGGIDVSRLPGGSLRSADWGTFVIGPGRRCLECAGQYRAELVAVEQSGDLDDPTYIQELPSDSPLRQRENVFVLSSALASLEVLRLVQLVGRPAGVTAPDEERYTYPASNVELGSGACHAHCAFPAIIGRGDAGGHPGTTTWP